MSMPVETWRIVSPSTSSRGLAVTVINSNLARICPALTPPSDHLRLVLSRCQRAAFSNIREHLYITTRKTKLIPTWFINWYSKQNDKSFTSQKERLKKMERPNSSEISCVTQIGILDVNVLLFFKF